VIVVF